MGVLAQPHLLDFRRRGVSTLLEARLLAFTLLSAALLTTSTFVGFSTVSARLGASPRLGPLDAGRADDAPQRHRRRACRAARAEGGGGGAFD